MNGEDLFQWRAPDRKRLEEYGFSQQGGEHVCCKEICDGQFRLQVTVHKNGDVNTQVIDVATEEPYTMHLIEDACGAFVGNVRAEYRRVLSEISEKCFFRQIFGSTGALRAISYVRETYGDELEYLWKKFPQNAVWRRKDNKKWYGAVLTVNARKLGLDRDGAVEILDVRMRPEEIVKRVDGVRYLPGYHMNKTHWITVLPDRLENAEELFLRIDESYRLAAEKRGG